MINTRFQELYGRTIHVFFHLYEGARKVQNTDCDIHNANIYINIGNLTLSKALFTEITILNFEIADSSISNTVFRLQTSSQDSVGSVQVKNSVLHDTFVWKYRPGGFVGFLFENTSFTASGDNKSRGICLFGATNVTVISSKFQINNMRSFEGSAIQMIGVDMIFEPPLIKELALVKSQNVSIKIKLYILKTLNLKEKSTLMLLLFIVLILI